MLRFLHSSSTLLFFLLAGSFFIAYVLQHNFLWAKQSMLWLHLGQLPLIAVSLLYGVLSIILSLSRNRTAPSRTLALWLGLCAAILFGVFACVKFGLISF